MQVIGEAVLEIINGGGKTIVNIPKDWSGIRMGQMYRITVIRPDDLDELAVSYHAKARKAAGGMCFTLRKDDGYIPHEFVKLTVSIDPPSIYEFANLPPEARPFKDASRSKDQG